jgi:uncharacterized protein YjlB
MVARTPAKHPLVVEFRREGGEYPEHMLYARDGEHAWRHAVYIVAHYHELAAGDVLTVRRNGD